MYTEDCTLENLDVAFLTLYAAKKYMVKTLAVKCGNFVLEQLSIGNACLALQRAGALDEVELWMKVRLFVEKYAPSVLASRGFLALHESTLTTLLSDHKLMILEADVLSHVLRWAVAKLAAQRSSLDQAADDADNDAAGDVTDDTVKDDRPQTIADIIKPFAHNIRFPVIPHKHLFPLVHKHQLLDASELHSILQYQAGHTAECASLPYKCEPRAHKVSTRFRIQDNFDVSMLITKDDRQRRKFTLEFRPTCAQPVTIFAVSIMCGPYLVRVCVYDADEQLVSFTERDFSAWPLKDCCREMCIILDDPVQCEASDEVMKIEVYISRCSTMYWYDNVITGKTSDTKHFKLKHFNPEIISKLHYLVK